MRRRRALGLGHRGEGQTLVEFSLALIPFMFILMGIVDFGRGIYTSNGVAQAAREVARVASVHQCSTWVSSICTAANWSPEITNVVSTQRNLVPGLAPGGVTITCVDISDAPVTIVSGGTCKGGYYIKVDLTTSFRLVTPFLPVPNPMTFTASAHVQVP